MKTKETIEVGSRWVSASGKVWQVAELLPFGKVVLVHIKVAHGNKASVLETRCSDLLRNFTKFTLGEQIKQFAL